LTAAGEREERAGPSRSRHVTDAAISRLWSLLGDLMGATSAVRGGLVVFDPPDAPVSRFVIRRHSDAVPPAANLAVAVPHPLFDLARQPGDAVLIDDLATHPAMRVPSLNTPEPAGRWTALGSRSLALIAVRYAGREGVVVLHFAPSPVPRPQAVRDALRTFAREQGPWLALAVMEARLAARHRRADVLHRVAEQAARARTQPELFDAVAAITGESFDVDRCVIGRWFADATMIGEYEAAWCAPGVPPPPRISIPQVSNPATAALASGEVIQLRRPMPEGSVAQAIGLASVLGAPIRDGEETIALIGLQMVRAERAWTDDEVDLLTAIAQQLAVNLRITRLVESLSRARAAAERSERIQKSLLDVLGEARPDREPDAALQRFLELAVDLTPSADAGSIMIKDGEYARFRAAVGYDLTAIREIKFPFSHLLSALPAEGGEHRRAGVYDEFDRHLLARGAMTERDYRILKSAGRIDQIKASLAMPIVIDGEIIGQLAVDSFSDPDAFLERDRPALRVFTDQIAVILRGAQIVQELRKLDAMKSDFVSIVSHELRSPTTNIVGYAELLTSSGGQQLEPVQRADAIAIIADESARLLNLIEELLELGRLERGQRPLQSAPVDLAGQVESYLVASRMGEDRVPFETEIFTQRPALADALAAQQVLANLVENAHKFAGAGSRILVTVDDDGDWIRLGVHDSGPGIAPADRDRVFGAFTQLERADVRRHGGLGLGLHISKRLVEQMGGSVALESPGRLGGSTFWVRLPAYTLARASPASSS
jgi:signal transduction histidine kinase